MEIKNSGHNLEQRWLSLFSGSTEEKMRMEFQRLINMYSRKHLHYHTMDHVAACLKLLDEVGGMITDHYSVELALWFHDAVYHPGKADNERKSADYASMVLKDAGINAAVISGILHFIEMTIHPSTPVTSDEKLLTDIDLSVLGSEPDTYLAYSGMIRKEYFHLPEFLYRRGRKKLLRLFLESGRIFHSEYFFNKYEKAARDNIKGELARL